MSGNPAADLAAFGEEWLKQNAGCDLIDHGFGADHGGELTVTKLRAVLGELVRLRGQNIGDAHAVAKVIAATNRHAKGDSLTQLHQAIDALEERFDERFDLLENDVPSQPERASCPCGCPVVEDMCSCPEPCPCEPDCAYCLVPNPMRTAEREGGD